MPESLPAEMSAFIWHEKESRRTAHQRRKQEREVKAQQTQAFLSNVTSGVEPPPFDLVLDQSERRLRVPSSCMGMVIGKKGEHVKSIEKDFKVTVKIEKDDASSDSILLVSGSSAAEVAAAVKALDFDSKILEVPKEIAGWVCGKAGRHLKLIREMTGVAVLSMKDSAEASEAQGEAHGDGTNPSRCSLEIKGLRENVEDAAMCMEAHMSYHSVFQEMEQVEKELDQRIADAPFQKGGASWAEPDRDLDRDPRLASTVSPSFWRCEGTVKVSRQAAAQRRCRAFASPCSEAGENGAHLGWWSRRRFGRQSGPGSQRARTRAWLLQQCHRSQAVNKKGHMKAHAAASDDGC
eukprot:s3157_g4.t2